jgi:archaellum biogenesis ATPase FlaH
MVFQNLTLLVHSDNGSIIYNQVCLFHLVLLFLFGVLSVFSSVNKLLTGEEKAILVHGNHHSLSPSRTARLYSMQETIVKQEVFKLGSSTAAITRSQLYGGMKTVIPKNVSNST